MTTGGSGVDARLGTAAETSVTGPRRPSLDIVIVNWNTGAYLDHCLQSIATADQTAFSRGKVVVVDNASVDRSLAAAEAAPAVTVLANDRNRGFAAACNQGARVGRADFILFLNPDTELRRDTLTRLFACISSMSEHGASIFGAQMVNRAGDRESSCSRFPTLRLALGEMTGLNRVAPRLFPLRHLPPEETLAGGVVDHVIGSFFVVNRQLFENLDGFDERFFMYNDEVDFAYRARAVGKLCYLCSEVLVYHEGGVSSDRVPGLRLYYFLRSRTQYARKYWPRWKSATLVALTLGIEIPLRLGISIVRKEVRETGRGALLYARYLLRPSLVASERWSAYCERIDAAQP